MLGKTGAVRKKKKIPLQKISDVIIPTLWVYNVNDKTTWRYLDCIVGGRDGHNYAESEPYVKEWVKNPDFKYEHLCKGMRD